MRELNRIRCAREYQKHCFSKRKRKKDQVGACLNKIPEDLDKRSLKMKSLLKDLKSTVLLFLLREKMDGNIFLCMCVKRYVFIKN